MERNQKKVPTSGDENLELYKDDIERTIQRLSNSAAQQEATPTKKSETGSSSDKTKNNSFKVEEEVDKLQEYMEAQCYLGFPKTNLENLEHWKIKESKNADFNIKLNKIRENIPDLLPWSARFSTSAGTFQKFKKDAFKVYYDMKRKLKEEEEDLDKLREIVERRCYFGHLMSSFGPLEERTINEINRRRMKESKKPITFHRDKNADFDITKKEIEEAIRDRYPLESVPWVARLLYDSLEEKYKPWSDSEGENMNFADGYMGDFSYKSLKNYVKYMDRLNVVDKNREVYMKAIKLMRQVEKLKDPSSPFSRDVVDAIVDLTTKTVKLHLMSLGMDEMDEAVDDFYPILMFLRLENNQPPLTLHEIGGRFDLTLEEVGRGVRLLRELLIEKGLKPAADGDKQKIITFFLQLKLRYMLMKNAGSTKKVTDVLLRNSDFDKEKKPDVTKNVGAENPEEIDFEIYYDQRRREVKNFDIDKYQPVFEHECYNGWTMKDVAPYEKVTIDGINLKRVKESKKPIKFHDKNADFDITVEEIEKELRENVPREVISKYKTRNVTWMAKCMYDYLEEKYRKKPEIQEDGSDEEFSFIQDLTESFDIEKLEKSVRIMDRMAKSNESTWTKDETDFYNIKRETSLKAIRLLRQVEKLKEHKKSCPEYKDRLEKMVTQSELIIATAFCYINIHCMDAFVKEFYPVLMKMRQENGKPPLTLHKIGGKFDLEMEEVEKALRMFGVSNYEEISFQQQLNLVFENLKGRFLFIKKAGERIEAEKAAKK